MRRPPCWPEQKPCPNECAQALYQREVYNRHHLPSPWDGWRFAGRVLVSPDGDRIAPERLRGMLWRESLRSRRDTLERGSAQVKKRVCRVETLSRLGHRRGLDTDAGDHPAHEERYP